MSTKNNWSDWLIVVFAKDNRGRVTAAKAVIAESRLATQAPESGGSGHE